MSDYPSPSSGGYQPNYQMGLGPRQNDGGATTALILGIVSLVLCGIFTGIPAIIVGRRSMRRIDSSGGVLDGRGMALAGVVLGWVTVAFTLIAIVLIVVLVVVAANSSTTSVDCTQIRNASRC